MTYKVVVAQLVSASGCGPEGRRFEPGLPPHFFCQNFGKKNMKPEKASLHAAVKRCFIIRRIASYGEAVLHKTPFQMKQLHFIPL